jgi:hypothetical protein
VLVVMCVLATAVLGLQRLWVGAAGRIFLICVGIVCAPQLSACLAGVVWLTWHVFVVRVKVLRTA